MTPVVRGSGTSVTRSHIVLRPDVGRGPLGIEVGVVEKVERLRAQLQGHPFRDPGIFRYTQIEIPPPRAAKYVSPRHGSRPGPSGREGKTRRRDRARIECD